MEHTIKAEAILHLSPLFSSLSEQQRGKLSGLCLVKKRERGEHIFFEGDVANGVYFMGSGQVKIFRLGTDGREAILHVFGAGQPFGEVAVFQGGHFPASAQCISSGESLFLPREALLQSLKEDPELAMGLLASLSSRLRSFAGKIESLTLMETPQRLAAYLLHASLESKKDTVTLDISKSLLAGMLGTARETLSRALSRFVEDGAISIEGRKVRILNPEYLESLVAGTENL